MKIKKYNNIPVIEQDYKVLISLKKNIGKIPIVPEVEWDTIGFMVENQRVVQLGLYERQLYSLPNNIGNLTALKELHLQQNELTSLPDSIGNLTALTKLNLVSNKLTSLPDSIGNLTALKELHLFNNKLTSLPDSIGNLTALTQLDLNCNKLTSLPKSIGNLMSLKELHLQQNELTSLPDMIGNLKSLKVLILHDNQLTSLPESIGNFTELEVLTLGKNKLISLPESIGKLTALKELHLFDNKLTSLPDTIGQLTSLQKLDLLENKLTYPLGSIGNLKSLVIDLDLVDPRKFREDPKLMEILNLLNSQQFKTVIEKGTPLLKIYRDYDVLYSWVGAAYKGIYNYDAADDVFRQGLSKSKRKSLLLTKIAEIEYLQGNLKNAINIWSQILLISGEINEQKHSAYLHLGYVAQGLGLDYSRFFQSADNCRSGMIRLNDNFSNQLIQLTKKQSNPEIFELMNVQLHKLEK